MVYKEDITNAITAHRQWKQHLHDAAITGKTDLQPVLAKSADECLFGKWLCGLLQEDIGSVDILGIKKIHEEFHKAAAEILELALSGKRTEALFKLSLGGSYTITAANLVKALEAWREKLDSCEVDYNYQTQL